MYLELTIVATSADTEIWLGDNRGHFVQISVDDSVKTFFVCGEVSLGCWRVLSVFPASIAWLWASECLGSYGVNSGSKRAISDANLMMRCSNERTALS